MLNRCAVSTLLTLSVAPTFADPASAPNTIKLGMVMPLTGPLATAGQQVVARARLYISQHGNTVAGKRIELIVRDDSSSADNGKRLVHEAIVNDKVDIIGGGPTPDLLGSAALITEAKKPTVIMLSSTTSVIENHRISYARVARSLNHLRSWPTGPFRTA
jgi:branched-chain amino acid transport system substrate-binding protein